MRPLAEGFTWTQEIPKRYPDIDLLLIHLGGTTIPGPHAPLLMVVSSKLCHPDLQPPLFILCFRKTMDGKQGIELVKLISPKLTIPIHFDDYDVFMVRWSPVLAHRIDELMGRTHTVSDI